MRWTSTAAALALLGPCWTPAGEVEALAPAPAPIAPRECSIEFERSTRVGASPQMGCGSLFQESFVGLGERVKADQVLGRLDSRDLQADLLRFKAQAEDQLEIRSREVLHAQAEGSLKQSTSLADKNYLSRHDYKLLLLAEQQAAIAVEQAKLVRLQAELQYQDLEARVRDRSFRAPHDGVVVEVLKHVGERVMPGEAAFIVVDDSHMLVTGYVDVGDAWRIRAGQAARVTPTIDGAELPIEREVFPGHVVFVDNRIDPQSLTCRVVVRVANRDRLLRSGLAARMEVEPSEPPGRPDEPTPPAPRQGE